MKVQAGGEGGGSEREREDERARKGGKERETRPDERPLGRATAKDEEKKGGRRLTGQRCVIAIYVSLQSSVYRHDKESRGARARAYRLKPFKERREQRAP